jgi:ATP-dependent DNA ligase
MPIDHKNLRLDHTHCRAICDEIGERLRETMGQESANMTPYLRRLIDRLDELDNVWSPGIVPDWIHEVKYDGYRMRVVRNGNATDRSDLAEKVLKRSLEMQSRREPGRPR